jgi:release factor glutamine methyltransferase
LNPTLTVRDAILHARKDLKGVSDVPGSDAQLILADILNQSRAWILTHQEVELSSSEKERFFKALSRYSSGDPLPYVLGWREFFGRRFNINESVLIPRPETEHLVEQALHFLRTYPEKRSAMDIGTGSGCIAISLLAELEDLHMSATDVSYEALEVARGNAKLYGVGSRIHFIQMDLTYGIRHPCDLICANLPYIPESMLENLEVARKEPILALNGGEDGLVYVRRLLREIPTLLLPGGCALLELEAGTSRSVIELAKIHIEGANFKIIHDYSKQDRVLVIDI